MGAPALAPTPQPPHGPVLSLSRGTARRASWAIKSLFSGTASLLSTPAGMCQGLGVPVWGAHPCTLAQVDATRGCRACSAQAGLGPRLWCPGSRHVGAVTPGWH